MTSWYSNLLTKTSSQISSLRSTLLSSEADGDAEDDTHVCRVLRNYYAEKARPLPAWLPPDPRAAAQAAPQTPYAQPHVGSRYGGLGGQQPASAGAGALSSLWETHPAQGQGRQPPPPSLRVGRPAAAAAAAGGRDELLAGPVPGSRNGSYHSAATSQSQPPAGGSAQDRLRQRLWGSRTTSPSSQGGQGPFQPPASAGAAPGGRGGSYDERFAPGAAYDGGRGGRGDGRDHQPYMGANAPWSNGGDDFMGGGGGGARQGLPSNGNGPRRQGLSSGSRGYR